MEAFGIMGMSMGSLGFVFGLIAFTVAQSGAKKQTELEADLRGLKKDVARLKGRLGPGDATS